MTKYVKLKSICFKHYPDPACAWEAFNSSLTTLIMTSCKGLNYKHRRKVRQQRSGETNPSENHFL